VTTEESVPISLADAGEYSENVYDYAKANDWKNADARLGTLKETIKNVRADVKSQSAAVDSLDTNLATLNNAVSSKDRQATMREANQVTLDVANMTTAYKLSVPVEVTRLDYYGRELEVWAQAKDADKLQATAREIRVTWDALRPSIEARSATEAKKFEALIAQVEGAKTPADNARVATLVLNEVDNLEKLFH
jgi:chromosome segregation ATPase